VIKIYIAALYSTRDHVREHVVPKLEACGFQVTSRWLWEEEPPGFEERSAKKDLDDVRRSDAVLLMTLPYGTMYKGGGRCWEAGYAMGLGKRVYAVGAREIIFCHHPEVLSFAGLDEMMWHLGNNPLVTRPRQMLDWCYKTFGSVAPGHVERATRLLEEAVELAQCAGVTRQTAQRLIERVFSRPPGKMAQEVGQVQNLLECFAECVGLDAAHEGRREFDRCRAVPQEEWDRRHAAKVEQGVASEGTDWDPYVSEGWDPYVPEGVE
jgi:hypothetical protein